MAMKAMKLAKAAASTEEHRDEGREGCRPTEEHRDEGSEGREGCRPTDRDEEASNEVQAHHLTYTNASKIPAVWVRIDTVNPNVRVTCYKELDAMVAIK